MEELLTVHASSARATSESVSIMLKAMHMNRAK